MLTASDILRLPFTPELTQAGIAYTLQALPQMYTVSGLPTYNQLRHTIIETATELAFRRYLTSGNIPHTISPINPFTSPNKADVYLGNRRCEAICQMITRRQDIRQINKDPNHLLKWSVYPPMDQRFTQHLNDTDLCIFVFITALLAPKTSDIERVLQANQPNFFIHLLPRRWACHSPWTSFGQLVLETNSSRSVQIEIHGQNKNRQITSEKIALDPDKTNTPTQDFYSLQCLHLPQIIDGHIGLYSSQLQQKYRVTQKQWSNVWVYGMEFFLVGYMSRYECRRVADARHPDAGTFSAMQREDDIGLPVQKLQSLPKLFILARNWGKRSHNY